MVKDAWGPLRLERLCLSLLKLAVEDIPFLAVHPMVAASQGAVQAWVISLIRCFEICTALRRAVLSLRSLTIGDKTQFISLRSTGRMRSEGHLAGRVRAGTAAVRTIVKPVSNCPASCSAAASNTTTPPGRMMMQMVGAFAEFERAMIRERTRRAGFGASLARFSRLESGSVRSRIRSNSN
jgi:hypothetical protein